MELADLNRVKLVFLRVDLDTAELTIGIRLDAEINGTPTTLALLLGFRLVCGKFNLAMVLVTAVRTLNGLLDYHEPSIYSSSGNACNPARRLHPFISFVERAGDRGATETFMSSVFSVTTVLLV